jgi:hypothetical protein
VGKSGKKTKSKTKGISGIAQKSKCSYKRRKRSNEAGLYLPAANGS